MRPEFPTWLLTISCALITMLLAAATADAAAIKVTTTQDRYDQSARGCSLREAITAARTEAPFAGCEASTSDHVILLPDGRYRITRPGIEDGNQTGDFDWSGPDDLMIRPAGLFARVVIDGNHLDRVFDSAGPGGLVLTNLTITGGAPPADDGGGIRAFNVGLVQVTVEGNESRFDGGGIAAYGSFGAAISTISGNSARGSGGGIYLPGGSDGDAIHATITANIADSDADGNGDGGGFSGLGPDHVTFENVINAGNLDLSPNPADRAPDCLSDASFLSVGTLSTQQIGAGGCLAKPASTANVIVASPRLNPLRMNGGQTPTHAIQPASAALGAAVPAECSDVDQRMLARPADDCDIGAYQLDRGPATGGTAALAGTRMTLTVTCPRRFKPACRMALAPVTRRKGAAMSKVKRVRLRSGKSRKVTFRVKPRFRTRVEAMIYGLGKPLVLRQKIRSKRIGGKRNHRVRAVFTRYRVRFRG